MDLKSCFSKPKEGIKVSKKKKKVFQKRNTFGSEVAKEVRADTELVKQLERLPDEVLVLILEMLPPTLLLLLLEGDMWIKKLVCAVKILCFRECTFITSQNLSKLLKPVGFQLRELYLDNIVSVKSSELCRFASRCKQLKVLSLKNTGILVQHLYTVFEQVRLEELSFTINPSESHPVKEMRWDNNLFFRQLKRLNLEVGDLTMFHYVIRYFLPFCYELRSLRLDFSVIRRYNDFIDSRFGGTVFGKKDPPDVPFLNSLIITWPSLKTLMTDNAIQWKKHHLLPLLEWLFFKRRDDIIWKKFWVPDGLETEEVLERCKIKPEYMSSASCLFITEGDVDSHNLDILMKCPPSSVQHLGFYVPRLNESHVKSIHHACGSSLRQLSAIATDRDNILMAIKPFFQILKGCTNITHLDISGAHVTDREGTSFCSAICLLKDLRTLSLPICAITDIPVHVAPTFLNDEVPLFSPPTARKRTCRHNTLNQNASEIFTRMVKTCTLVEDFHLSGCSRCGQSDAGSVFCENILSNLYHWSKLKHLRIENVPSLRLFSFLDTIAEHCDEFMSLHLSNVGHQQVFHFMTSIIKVLKYAKNFAFLRLVHFMFHWGDACFWDAVAHAKKLQGLCIASEVSDTVNANMVLLALMELPLFHVFHLCCKSPVQNETLYQKLRTMLSRNTNRGFQIENVNFIFEHSHHDPVTGLMREPHCHVFHCGIRDSSAKGPCF